jgi:hypothetical protein
MSFYVHVSFRSFTTFLFIVLQIVCVIMSVCVHKKIMESSEGKGFFIPNENLWIIHWMYHWTHFRRILNSINDNIDKNIKNREPRHILKHLFRCLEQGKVIRKHDWDDYVYLNLFQNVSLFS